MFLDRRKFKEASFKKDFIVIGPYVLLLLIVFLVANDSYGAVNIESGFKDAQSWAVKIGGLILGIMIVVVGIFYSIGSSSASQKFANWVMGAFIISAGGGISAALLGFWQ